MAASFSPRFVSSCKASYRARLHPAVPVRCCPTLLKTSFLQVTECTVPWANHPLRPFREDDLLSCRAFSHFIPWRCCSTVACSESKLKLRPGSKLKGCHVETPVTDLVGRRQNLLPLSLRSDSSRGPHPPATYKGQGMRLLQTHRGSFVGFSNTCVAAWKWAHLQCQMSDTMWYKQGLFPVPGNTTHVAFSSVGLWVVTSGTGQHCRSQCTVLPLACG